jgi:hypothetical protein
MSITRGRIPQAHFITVYGQDGVGKTSFAAGAPDMLFLDAEGGTLHMDVARESIDSYAELNAALDALISGKKEYSGFKSVAFDSLDWLTPKIYEHVCATIKHPDHGTPVKSIEGYGYGKGYVFAREVWQSLVTKCKEIRAKNINVILLAHAQVFSIDSPDTTGTYKQFDLKLPRTSNNDIAALFREACDAVLFASFKLLTPKDDPRALNGGRVLRTQQAPGWAAKNRFGLPDEIILPELERDQTGAIRSGQEAKLWAVYADSVKNTQQKGPDYAAVLSLAEKVPDHAIREKAISAVKAASNDPVALTKHMMRLKTIVSMGTDSEPKTQQEEI